MASIQNRKLQIVYLQYATHPANHGRASSAWRGYSCVAARRSCCRFPRGVRAVAVRGGAARGVRRCGRAAVAGDSEAEAGREWGFLFPDQCFLDNTTL